MYVIWTGRAHWVFFLTAIAMFLPLILLRKIDGPEVDRAVAITMGLAALTVGILGLRWNQGVTFRPEARRHAVWGIPMQLWALPMALFAILLATGTITTAEEPAPGRDRASTRTVLHGESGLRS